MTCCYDKALTIGNHINFKELVTKAYNTGKACSAPSLTPDISTPVFFTLAESRRCFHSCIFISCILSLFHADISTPAFSAPAFSVPPVYVYFVTITTAAAHHRQTKISLTFTYPTFPWPTWNSLTFPGFQSGWPPWFDILCLEDFSESSQLILSYDTLLNY